MTALGRMRVFNVSAQFAVFAWAIVACFSHAATPLNRLVLSPTQFGPLPLTSNAMVSEAGLRQLFPDLKIKYEIGQGDSPDFHYFEGTDKQGNLIFAIKSFIEGESGNQQKSAAPVPLQLLEIFSPKVKDIHGVRVGGRVRDIVSKRGKNLEFGASHFDVFLGGASIYYNVATGKEQSPERLKLKDAEDKNWKIRSISWPSPAWE